jgi:regulator of cell morphogenesis and NO signaling
MNIDETKSVAEIAVEFPFSKKVFDSLSIDYCCGGQTAIGDACTRQGIDATRLSELLDAEMAHENTGLTAEPDFSNMSLAALCDHIVRRHHEFTRAENARIAALLEKVCGVHGDNHGELLEIEAIFTILRKELEEHMLKEERMLFPYISLMESSLDFRVPVPAAPFGTTRNPVAVMMREHDAAAELLAEIQRSSNDFTVPEDGCSSYRELYAALNGLRHDLHHHIHLENNILFPKAIRMEDGTALPKNSTDTFTGCVIGEQCCH